MILKIILFIAIVVIIVLIVESLSQTEDKVLAERIENMNLYFTTDKQRQLNKSILERITQVIKNKLEESFGETIKSSGSYTKTQLLIMQAGKTNEKDVMTIRAEQGLYAIILTCAAYMMSKGNFYYVPVGAAFGAYLPILMLRDGIAKRREIIKDEIPDFLDLLASTFPGSKGLEDAIARICKRSKGVIPSEFELMVSEINAGKRKKDALRALSDRCGVKEIEMLVNQIIQSEVLGTGLEDTLKNQATKMRILKKTQAEIKAKKASIQLLFPTMLLLVSIILVVVGPSISQLMDAMGNV